MKHCTADLATDLRRVDHGSPQTWPRLIIRTEHRRTVPRTLSSKRSPEITKERGDEFFVLRNLSRSMGELVGFGLAEKVMGNPGHHSISCLRPHQRPSDGFFDSLPSPIVSRRRKRFQRPLALSLDDIAVRQPGSITSPLKTHQRNSTDHAVCAIPRVPARWGGPGESGHARDGSDETAWPGPVLFNRANHINIARPVDGRDRWKKLPLEKAHRIAGVCNSVALF